MTGSAVGSFNIPSSGSCGFTPDGPVRSPEINKMYLGIDPGRQKFGWALADRDGRLIASGIVPIESAEVFFQYAGEDISRLHEWLIEGSLPASRQVCRVFCGDGTGHAFFAKIAAKAGLKADLVQEKNTTLEARDVFWTLHPPVGFWKLCPLSLQVPSRCVDDLAAYCIIKRALASADAWKASKGKISV